MFLQQQHKELKKIHYRVENTTFSLIDATLMETECLKSAYIFTLAQRSCIIIQQSYLDCVENFILLLNSYQTL